MTFCIILVFIVSGIYAQEYQRVPCVMHVHSTFSDNGHLTIEQIAQHAVKSGMKVVMLSDHDIMKYSYYGWPMVFSSVLKTGPEKYLSEINRVQQKFPGLVIIPGVESAPFYYWSGNLFKKNLTLNEWHKHMLVIGLDKPEQYKKLPVIGNEPNAGKFSFVLLLCNVLMFLFGYLLFFLRMRKPGWVVMAAGIIMLIISFPFKTLPFDQYHGDQDDRPYQFMIDYVNKTAPETGMVFWAHPESPNYDKALKMKFAYIQTKMYADSLYNTVNYTGFAYFQEGANVVGIPGGLWDKILVDFCKGNREYPVWATGELDYRQEGALGTYINTVQNILLLEKTDKLIKQTVTKCIKSGRFYVIMKSKPDDYEIVLDMYLIKDNVLNLSLSTTDKKQHKIEIKIINEGKIISLHNKLTPVAITLPCQKSVNRLSYYRVECAADNNCKLVTNPVFWN
jgi:hypothetical protein